MNSLLSLIMCIAMLFGTGVLPAVPLTQTALDIGNVSVSAGEESADVAPDLRITLALGSEKTDLTAQVSAGDNPRAALRFLPDSTQLWTGSERVFNADFDALSALTNGWSAEVTPSAPMGALIDSLSAAMAAGEISDDFPSLFLDALATASETAAESVDFPMEEGGSVPGKTLDAQISYEMLLNALDVMREGGGTSAQLLDAYLRGTVKPDGTVCASFLELLGDASDERLSVNLMCARGEGIKYDLIAFDPTNDEDRTGAFSLQSTVYEGLGASIEFSMGLSEADADFVYDARIDLQGTLDDLRCLIASADMSSVKNNGGIRDAVGMDAESVGGGEADAEFTEDAEIAAQEIHTRHFELNAAKTDEVWNAACNVTVTSALSGETAKQADISVGYAETRDESGATTGVIDLVFATDDRDFGLLFDVKRTEEPFADMLQDPAVMDLTASKEDIPAMVFALDLQDLRNNVLSVLTEDSVLNALRLLDADAMSILQSVMPA